MQVALLQIENFRGIKTGRVQFRDHAVLIGPNNSGKTTIIEALALVLGRDRLIRNLTEHDFFGSDPQADSKIENHCNGDRIRARGFHGTYRLVSGRTCCALLVRCREWKRLA